MVPLHVVHVNVRTVCIVAILQQALYAFNVGKEYCIVKLIATSVDWDKVSRAVEKDDQ